MKKNRLTDNDSGKSAKCVRCDCVVKRMKAPYEHNWDGGVDVLFYPFYGSNNTVNVSGLQMNRNKTIQPKWGVMCDECFKKL